jgi:hypothetical protein
MLKFKYPPWYDNGYTFAVAEDIIPFLKKLLIVA